MKKYLALVLVIALCSCSGYQMNSRDKGAAAGGALGAGLGAIIGHKTGSAGAGVAIGAGLGAISGGLIGNSMDKQDEAMDQMDQRLSAQDQMIQENERMIRELKAGGLDVSQTDRGIVVNLPDVLFDFNSHRLRSDSYSKIGEITDVVRKYPDRSVLIEGHTDSVGTMTYNKRLSEDRAYSVADEIVAKGVSRSRLTVKGYGESRPVDINTTNSGRSKNRRVEVVIQN